MNNDKDKDGVSLSVDALGYIQGLGIYGVDTGRILNSTTIGYRDLSDNKPKYFFVDDEVIKVNEMPDQHHRLRSQGQYVYDCATSCFLVGVRREYESLFGSKENRIIFIIAREDRVPKEFKTQLLLLGFI